MLWPKFITWFVNFLPESGRLKIEKIVFSFTDAMKFVKNKKMLAGVGLFSFMIWGLTLLSTYSILWGLDVILPVYAYLFIIAAGVFGMVIPSTSGGIGVYHAISTAALLLFRVVPEKALAFAIISHAFDFFPNIILGIILFVKENTSVVSIKGH
jgi:uncharacterized protein (TIRG00374 family)